MKTLSRILITLAVLSHITGCGNSSEKRTVEKTGEKFKVATAQVQRRAVLDVQKIMGTVEARSQVVIETKLQARVERIAVALGTRIRAGDLLAELDTRDLTARVRQAQAVQEQTAQDFKRFETLLAQQAATRQEFDAVNARAVVAEANRQEAEAMLSYARIVAPLSGVVTQKFIQAGDLAVPGRPLFGLEQEGSPRFVLTIPESNIAQISLGDSARIEFPGPDTILTGIVKELSPSSNPVTRSFEVKIDLPESTRLRPGQFGRLLLPSAEAATLFVPSSAVVQRGQLELVYVVTPDNRASLRLIRTGRVFSEWTQVLSGISEGETVVSSGAAGLSDGDQIERMP